MTDGALLRRLCKTGTVPDGSRIGNLASRRRSPGKEAKVLQDLLF